MAQPALHQVEWNALFYRPHQTRAQPFGAWGLGLGGLERGVRQGASAARPAMIAMTRVSNFQAPRPDLRCGWWS